MSILNLKFNCLTSKIFGVLLGYHLGYHQMLLSQSSSRLMLYFWKKCSFHVLFEDFKWYTMVPRWYPMVPKITKSWYMKSYNLETTSESILSLLKRLLWTFSNARFQGKNLHFLKSWKYEVRFHEDVKKSLRVVWIRLKVRLKA